MHAFAFCSYVRVRWRAQFPAIVKLTGRVHGQLIEWLGLPPPRNPRPQSAQARTPGIRPGHGGRDRFANDGGSPGHGGLGFRGSEGALLTATTMVSELQRVNETLHEEHTALQQHVGSLEGEMAAMRADLQALRVDLSRGGDDRILGKIGNTVGGLTRASTNDEPAGTVTVRVLRATGLVAADMGGTSDPYVVVQSGSGKKEKTSVKKGTVSPLWDETLELSVFDVAAPLSFEVWDHDKIGMNDSLGAGEILLAQCAPGTPTALRVALSTQGTVEVVVTFSPAEPVEEPEELSAVAAAQKKKAWKHAAEEVEAMVAAAKAPTPTRAEAASSTNSSWSRARTLTGGLTRGSTNGEPAGTVTVRVLRATSLIAGDKGGMSDPYVVVQSAGGKKEKTSVKKGTVNPIWDETLELSVFDVAAPLSFEVWDHDKIGMNDSLGASEILLAQCAPGTPTALTIALSTQGTVEVVVTFFPAESTEEPEELTAVAAAQKKKAWRKAQEEVGTMVAAAKAAEVAEAADSTNSSWGRARTSSRAMVAAAKGTVAALEVAEAADSTEGGSVPAGLGEMGSSTAEAGSSWSRARTLTGGLTRASTNDEPTGMVTVRVLRATSLIAADKGGTSDPYVVVQSGSGEKEKTSVKKGTVNPIWDETLELSVFDAAAPLSFEVWDHDKIGMNDSLGAGEILLAQCSPGTPTALRVALSTQGTVEVVVTFSPAEPVEEPEEFTAAAAQKQMATRTAAVEVEAMVAAAQRAAAAAEAGSSTKGGGIAAGRWKLGSSMLGGLGAAAAAEQAADSTNSSWSRAKTLAGGLARASTNEQAADSGSVAAGRWKLGSSVVGGLARRRAVDR